jgi:hypothetical protein
VDEIKFVLKTFLATLLMIALLQIKIGDKTIESRAYQMAAQSKLVFFLGDIARGAVELGKQLKTQVDQAFNKPKSE